MENKQEPDLSSAQFFQKNRINDLREKNRPLLTNAEEWKYYSYREKLLTADILAFYEKTKRYQRITTKAIQSDARSRYTLFHLAHQPQNAIEMPLNDNDIVLGQAEMEAYKKKHKKLMEDGLFWNRHPKVSEMFGSHVRDDYMEACRSLLVHCDDLLVDMDKCLEDSWYDPAVDCRHVWNEVGSCAVQQASLQSIIGKKAYNARIPSFIYCRLMAPDLAFKVLEDVDLDKFKDEVVFSYTKYRRNNMHPIAGISVIIILTLFIIAR